MFHSAIWEALLDAERAAGAGAVVIEELFPVPGSDQWEARQAEPRSSLLARAADAADVLRPLLPPPPPPPPRAGRAAPAPAPPLPPVVALLLPRSADYVAAALAALAAGAAFLPLDGSGGPRAAAVGSAAAAARAARAAVLVIDALSPPPPPEAGAAASAQQQPLRVMSVDELFSRGGGGGGGATGSRGGEQQKGGRGGGGGPSKRMRRGGRWGPAAPSLPLPYYCLMPTSGTIASSKLVRLTEDALLRRCWWALAGHSGEEHDDDDARLEPGYSRRDRHPERPPLLEPGDAVMVATSPAFVDHLAQVFAPLLFAGAEVIEMAPLPMLRRGPGGELRAVGSDPGPLRLVVAREHEVAGAGRPPPLPLLARPRALVAALEQCRATHFTTVPSVLAAIVACGGHRSFPLRLRCLISSGEPLAVALAEALLGESRGDGPPGSRATLAAAWMSASHSRPGEQLARPRLLNLYGSTETSGDAAWLDVGWWLFHGRGAWNDGSPALAARSVAPAGVPLDAGVELSLGQRPAPGCRDPAVGEVLVRGWCVAGGYHHRPRVGGGSGRQEEQEEEEDDDSGAFRMVGGGARASSSSGWFPMGDLGRWIYAGDGHRHAFLHLEGRRLPGGGGGSAFEKLPGGVRVDFAAVEAALLRAAGGAVAVRAWPLAGNCDSSSGGGSYLAAYVESPERGPQDGGALRLGPGDPLIRAFRSAIDSTGLPTRFHPTAVLVMRALPRSAGAGKLLRAALPDPSPPPLPPTTTRTAQQAAQQRAQQTAMPPQAPPAPQTALPQTAQPQQPQQPLLGEGAALTALRAALAAVAGDGDVDREGRPLPPLEPAEDALQRAGAGAASRVAVAAAAALGVQPPLVFAFPSARQLARVIACQQQQEEQDQEEQHPAATARRHPAASQKRAREEEDGQGNDDEEAAAAASPASWPPADEAWSVPLHMCVDASPVVVPAAPATAASCSGAPAPATAAAASHGGELAFWPLLPDPRGGGGGGGAGRAPPAGAVVRLRLPGSLDAGLAAVGRRLVAVVRRGGGEPCVASALHLATRSSAWAAGAAPPMPRPLSFPGHVSSAPAVLPVVSAAAGGRATGDDARRRSYDLFLATHAPDPRLVVARAEVARAEGGPGASAVSLERRVSARLPAPSTATPLVLLAAESGGGSAAATTTTSQTIVVAMLDGSLVAFLYSCRASREQAPQSGRLLEVWHSHALGDSTPIFGAPVKVPLPGGGALVAAAQTCGRVRAVRAADGAFAWVASVGRAGGGALLFARLAVVPVEAACARGTGAAAPVVVAATEDGVLHGLDGATGRQLWRLELPGGRGVGSDAGLCSPLAVALPNGCGCGGGGGGGGSGGGGAAGLVVAAHDGRVFGVRLAGASAAAVISEQRVPAAVYGAPALVGVDALPGARGHEGETNITVKQEVEEEDAAAAAAGPSWSLAAAAAAAAAAEVAVAVVLIGCRDDRVRAVRVSL